MKSLVRSIILITIIVSIVGCIKDETPIYELENLTGFVQKGPYINGTAITVSELNENLNSTGKIFSSQIFDNTGSFNIEEITLNSKYIEIRADGFYFDEIKGEKSIAQLTLFGLADISNKSTINVNILTQLEKERVKYLVNDGMSFPEAKSTAQSEILGIFGFSLSEMKESELLNITNGEEEDALLLAISLIIAGNRSVANLTEMIAKLSSDLSTDGKIDNEQYKTELLKSAYKLKSDSIRNNLLDRYNNLGEEVNIGDFESYLNQYISDINVFTIQYSKQDISCHGSSDGSINLSIQGGNPPFSFDWATGQSANELNNLNAGVYEVLVTDSYDISKTLKISIDEPDSILIQKDSIVYNFSNDSNDGAIFLSVTGGRVPYTYSWEHGDANLDAINIGEGNYSLVVIDSAGCTASINVGIKSELYYDNRDGNEYGFVKIGNQYWMNKNLAYLPHVNKPSELSYSEGRYYVLEHYDNDLREAQKNNNYNMYGSLYNWVAARKVCPAGWKLPSHEDYLEMEATLIVDTSYQSTVLMSENYYGIAIGGSNTTGFSAVPSSSLDWNPNLGFQDSYTSWFWTTTNSLESDSAYIRFLYGRESEMNYWLHPYAAGLSVRCIKDAE